MEEICGFFIIESHVLETTSGFRSEREVEELWDAVVSRLSSAIGSALVEQKDPDTFLRVKEYLTAFVMTLEVIVKCRRLDRNTHDPVAQSYSYSTHSLHSLTLALFEKYTGLLETEFSRKLDSVRSVFIDLLLVLGKISSRLCSKMITCQCISLRCPRKSLYSVAFG